MDGDEEEEQAVSTARLGPVRLKWYEIRLAAIPALLPAPSSGVTRARSLMVSRPIRRPSRR